MPRPLLAFLVLPLFACGAARSGGPSAQSWSWFEEGRRFAREGRREEATAAFRWAIEADPRNMEAYVFLQAEGGPVPDPPPEMAPLADALAIPDAPARAAALESWVATSPDDAAGWRSLGEARLASAAAEGAVTAFEEALGLFDRDPRAWDGLARARFDSGDWSGALVAAREAARRDPGLVDSQIYLAVDELVDRKYRDAIRRLADLALRRPDAPLAGEQRLVWWLGYDRALKRMAWTGDWAAGAELAREGTTRFQSASIESLAALFELALGREDEARRRVERALELDPYQPRAARLFRRLAFADGRYAEGLAAWARTVPIDQVLDPANELAPVYREIDEAARVGDRERLARASLAAGWFDEAEALGLALDPEARRFRRFLDDLVRFVLTHDADLEEGRASPSTGEFVHEVEALWGETPPFSFAADLETWYVVASENDPLAPAEGSLGAYLARYGYFFDLSDAQGWVDFRLMHAVSRRTFTAVADGESFRYSVLVSDDTPVPSYDEFQWGDLRRAGRTFLSRNGYYLSADALVTSRPALVDLARQGFDPPDATRTGDEYDPVAARELARRNLGPFLQAGDPTSWDAATWHRFAARVLAQRLENTGCHELGHVVDFQHLVPFSSHPFENLSILVGHGFSQDLIHTRFERAAETYSLATSPNTALVLLDNLDRLEIDRTSLSYLIRLAWTGEPPEDSPYYEGALQIFQGVAELSGGPETGVAAHVASLPEDRVRTLAAELAADEGVH